MSCAMQFGTVEFGSGRVIYGRGSVRSYWV